MKKKNFTYLVLFVIALLYGGCQELDSMVVPIHNSTKELNSTASNLTVLEDTPFHTTLHFRNKKFVIVDEHF
ncbi:MAG: hypothetical protein P794_01440 [Epsilonproteobacteria bacterium (ex Lamellibrachia satsuma)]|nr:MAG: hypothetical protein P794_01440 [Epsilonproteobacteria bacterium (ex Lamellibrachia satsuma)]